MIAPSRAQPERTLFVRLTSPVRTRRGGFAKLKTTVFALLLCPAFWLLWQWAENSLGARPVLELVHQSGLWTVRLLLLTLALTPARWLLDWPQSVQLRRMIGVATACYATGHLTLYAITQNWHWLHVAAEIVHRFYLAIGFAALLGLLTLAATSTDATMKRLGRNWKKLHRLIYAIAPLALLHFFLQAKSDVSQAVIMTGLFVWLMAWRLAPAERRAALWLPLVLASVAIAGTILIELAWYGLATGISPRRILLANLRLIKLRPSHWVAIYTAAAAILIATRQLTKTRLPTFFQKTGARRQTLELPPVTSAERPPALPRPRAQQS